MRGSGQEKAKWAHMGRLGRLRRVLARTCGLSPKAERLYLEVTHRCNLRCIGCCTNAGREKPDALTLAEQKWVVAQAHQIGARVVSLSGSGEPLLYEHLFALMEYIRRLEMRAVIFTNGTLVDADAARFLVDSGAVVYFQLPSLRPDVVDEMTGRAGAHTGVEYTYSHDGVRKTVQVPSGLKALLDLRAGASGRDPVKLEALITRANAASLPEVAAFSHHLGLELHLETPVFKGRAIENYDRIVLTNEQYGRLYEQLVSVLGREFFRKLSVGHCPVERNPAVWTNGDVGICSTREANVGNVRDKPLDVLFARAQKVKRKEDCHVAAEVREGKYFPSCPSRRYHLAKYGLTCMY